MMVEIVVHLWYLMKCALWAMIADATLLERCIEALKQVGLVPLFPQHLLGRKIKYRKVASSRPVYYSKVTGLRPKVTVHKGQISPS